MPPRAIAKVCGKIVDWNKRLIEFLNQLTEDVQQIAAENASLKTNGNGNMREWMRQQNSVTMGYFRYADCITISS